ncbi:MAG: putative glycoside hydrolase, partial [Lachnospiraceae bacterium]|nr:putative glycoside hydrolase [Lachnospiraceae bacterium]
MENIFYEGIRTKRRRRKKGPVILLLLLAAVLIGFGGYKISQKLLTDEEDEKDPGSEVLVVDNMIEAASWDAADANSDGSDPDSGVYKLWTEPKPTEAVVTQTPDYDEEVWMADFVDTRERVDAKGIYVSSAYINKKLNDAIDLIDSTELNAIVIDIKSDGGYITYRMDHPLAKEIGACTSTIGDINATIKKLKDHGIYTIARIVSLKDPVLAEKRKDLALKNKDGSIFRDSSGLAWVNPYEDEVWEYLLEICKQCVAVGFDEVNLDYIRFATDKGMANVDFGPKAEEMTRIEVITEGIKKICEVIKPMGAFVSCDVYGAIISSSTDARIVGQSYFNMAKYLDYICPMVYPSHYGNGYYGLDYPDTHPYELVYHALMDSQKVLYMIDPAENKAIVRPWLQDFTATWVSHHLN